MFGEDTVNYLAGFGGRRTTAPPRELAGSDLPCIDLAMEREVDHGDWLSEALALIGRAIERLDEARAPAEIAAQLDLAYHQLQRLVTLPPDAPMGDEPLN